MAKVPITLLLVIIVSYTLAIPVNPNFYRFPRVRRIPWGKNLEHVYPVPKGFAVPKGLVAADSSHPSVNSEENVVAETTPKLVDVKDNVGCNCPTCAGRRNMIQAPLVKATLQRRSFWDWDYYDDYYYHDYPGGYPGGFGGGYGGGYPGYGGYPGSYGGGYYGMGW